MPKYSFTGIVVKQTDRTRTRQHTVRDRNDRRARRPPPRNPPPDVRRTGAYARGVSAGRPPAVDPRKPLARRLFSIVVSRAPWPVSRATYLVSVGSATGTGRQMLKIDGDGGGRQTTGSQPEGKGQRDGV